MKTRALILLGPGSNRDRDALEALRAVGAEGDILPLSELGSSRGRPADYGMLVIPGGFSYGDALGAGALLALDLQRRFAEELGAFAARGRPVIGICNGFQALVKAGILPGPDFQEPERTVTLARNERGGFECRWVGLLAPPSTSVWTRGLEGVLACPVAHGEGRIAARDPGVLERLRSSGRIALVYAATAGSGAQADARAGGFDLGAAGGSWPANPNGSALDIAGLGNAEGNVLGLMPHPENAIRPRRRAGGGHGAALALHLFRNGVDYAAAL